MRACIANAMYQIIYSSLSSARVDRAYSVVALFSADLRVAH